MKLTQEPVMDIILLQKILAGIEIVQCPTVFVKAKINSKEKNTFVVKVFDKLL